MVNIKVRINLRRYTRQKTEQKRLDMKLTNDFRKFQHPNFYSDRNKRQNGAVNYQIFHPEYFTELIDLKHQIESPTQCLEQWEEINAHQGTLSSKFRTLEKRHYHSIWRKRKSLIYQCSKIQMTFDFLKETIKLGQLSNIINVLRKKMCSFNFYTPNQNLI